MELHHQKHFWTVKAAETTTGSSLFCHGIRCSVEVTELDLGQTSNFSRDEPQHREFASSHEKFDVWPRSY